MLQIRHKGHWPRALFEAAGRIRRLCEQSGTTLIINDRADIALILGAGLHVGQDDMPPADARRLIGPGVTLGYSTHNEEQLAAEAGEPASYLAIGPIFDTQSKLNPDPVVGVEALRTLRNLTEKPLVAIGGITRQNARSVLEAGADAVAVIGDLFPANCTATTIHERMADWQRTMDPHG